MVKYCNERPVFKTREETQAWLDKIGVKGYSIRDDLTVDVAGNVIIRELGLDLIPVRFGVVDGLFDCDKNRLTSLIGAPDTVFCFQCRHNQLTDLIGAPKTCHSGFHADNNPLTSLKGSPAECGGSFWCTDTLLTSLIGGPKKCNKAMFDSNQLTSLIGGPEQCMNIWCGENQLTSLDGLPKDYKYVECEGNPDMLDISVVPDGCTLIYDHAVVTKNQAAKHLAALNTVKGFDTATPSPKPNRLL